MVNRIDVPDNDKKKIREEQGGKCANPACPINRTHIHHIKEWSVYQSNDQEILIAVCPTCHDQIHNGSIIIDDNKLFEWKKIKRDHTKRDHLYVEPNEKCQLMGCNWKKAVFLAVE